MNIRNLPCPCGSGLKAKKCCEPKFEQEKRRLRQKQFADFRQQRLEALALKQQEVPLSSRGEALLTALLAATKATS